jgi:hypothetical protein
MSGVRLESPSRRCSDLLGRVSNDERQAQVDELTARYRRGAHLEKLVRADERPDLPAGGPQVGRCRTRVGTGRAEVGVGGPPFCQQLF